MHDRADLPAAKRAAVCLTLPDSDTVVGHGLALSLPPRGDFVLTCHHVVAKAGSEELRACGWGSPGRDGTPIAAHYEEGLSDPDGDVGVLRLAEAPKAAVNPLLHVPDPEFYEKTLPARAMSPGAATPNFPGTLGMSSPIRLYVDEVEREYVLDHAYELGDAGNVAEGTSGSPVYCEGGIVGLVHFARPESPVASRVAYTNPLTAWEKHLPELAELTQPFACADLRERAHVLRAVRTAERAPVEIRGYRPDVYLARSLDDEVERAFERGGLLCLVGKPNSGKTRLMCELLDRHKDAVVVWPENQPPSALGDKSVFRDRDVVVIFENADCIDEEWKPLQWWREFKSVAGRTVLIVTSHNEDDWEKTKAANPRLMRELHSVRHELFLSRKEGDDLSPEEGWDLAQQLGLDQDEFEARFDGTPGSLAVHADQPPRRERQTLPPTAASRIYVEELAEGDRTEGIPTNLPALTSRFLGRERERTQISELIDEFPLVTLTGPPGSGKTRLSQYIAWQKMNEFTGGVWFVDLTAANEPDALMPAIISALGEPVTGLGTQQDAVVERLRSERSLLLLDGPEQVLKAAAMFVARVTADAPAGRVVVTCQERLGLPWEREYEVPPMGAAAPGERPERSSGVHLLLALAGRSTDDLSPADAARGNEICEKLYGNPAALEIAGADVRDKGLEEVKQALGEGAGSAAEALDVAVTQSLRSLDPTDTALFTRLAVFPGWFTLSAARAIADGGPLEGTPVAAGLRNLADRALLRVDTRDPLAERYELPPSVQATAHARLAATGEAEDLRRRHAEYYLGVLDDAVPRLNGRASTQWLERLAAERSNFRAALRWAIEFPEPELGWRLGAGLWPVLLRLSRFTEARRWLGQLAQLQPDDPTELGDGDAAALAEVLTAAGCTAYHQTAYRDARRYIEKALEVRRHRPVGREEADAYNVLGVVARRQGDFETAHTMLQEAMAISRRHHDLPRLADQVNSYGNLLREEQGDLETALNFQQESLALYTKVGSEAGRAMAQCDRGWVYMNQGHLAMAQQDFARSLATRERIKDEQGEAQSLNGLGRIVRLKGDAMAAIELHQQAYEIVMRIGDRLRMAESIEAIALARHALDDSSEARRLIADADAIRDEVSAPRPPAAVAAIASAFGGGST